MSDYFVDDGEFLLVNKLGIVDPDELKMAEGEIVAARMAELIDKPIHGNYDFKMLKSIHEKLFSDIYDFAGKTRTVRIAKDNSVFCYPEYIDDYQENAGWYIAYEDMKAEELLNADIKSFNGDTLSLIELIQKHINEIDL